MVRRLALRVVYQNMNYSYRVKSNLKQVFIYNCTRLFCQTKVKCQIYTTVKTLLLVFRIFSGYKRGGCALHDTHAFCQKSTYIMFETKVSLKRRTVYGSWFPQSTCSNRSRTAHNATKTTHVRYRCYHNLAEIIRTMRDLFSIAAQHQHAAHSPGGKQRAFQAPWLALTWLHIGQ